MTTEEAALAMVDYATRKAKEKHPTFPKGIYGMSSILAEESLEAITAANDVMSGGKDAGKFFTEVSHVAAVCQRILEGQYEYMAREGYDG